MLLHHGILSGLDGFKYPLGIAERGGSVDVWVPQSPVDYSN